MKGARPVATMTASTSSSSTFSLVLKSVSSMCTGFTPGTPAATKAVLKSLKVKPLPVGFATTEAHLKSLQVMGPPCVICYNSSAEALQQAQLIYGKDGLVDHRNKSPKFKKSMIHCD